MAAVAGQLTTFDPVNFVGPLFRVTPADTPFLSMTGGLSLARSHNAKETTWQTIDNAAAAQPSVLEGADATFSGRNRSEIKQVLQIFHEGVEISYSKMINTGGLGSGGAAPVIPATPTLGNNPVQDERVLQLTLKTQKVARDVEVSFLNGTFQDPNSNASARRMRGILPAITTNAVAAGGAQLSKSLFDQIMRTMATNDAMFTEMVLFANAYQVQKISEILGFAPMSRTVGGVAVSTVLTEFAQLSVKWNRHMPTDTVLLVDVSVCEPVAGVVPGLGSFFAEPLAKTGSAEKWQLYGEITLEYGPENWHGKITGLATS